MNLISQLNGTIIDQLNGPYYIGSDIGFQTGF